MAASFEWRSEFRSPRSNKFALVVTNQPVSDSPVFGLLWKNACVRVAADGGANRLYDLLQSNHSSLHEAVAGLDAIVGDLDSLHVEVKQYFTTLANPAKVIHYPDQNLYDLDKAVNWVRSNYAHDIDIVILGDLGGRVDHGLRQVHYLYLFQPGPAYTNGRVFLVTSQGLLILLKPGHHKIWVQKGDGNAKKRTVGLIPIGKPSLITTNGLEQDVKNLVISMEEKIIRGPVLQGTSTLDIETSDTILLTMDISAF
ncbi:hypothetical protein ASPFODRAFT_41647 [Aspergillus luchuensis CBS 106.47]|uniref:Thiamine pyrophosphokinase n=1 Tax=Aspergillus luchuensis (strain CBS 106.47) TaxID=1137211 RepID=A0A1M3TWN1_ASPLC|nr:hypothetical protein ASPFODRAFT_41647 [Aspergillus luchuensis CBS 106.47]